MTPKFEVSAGGDSPGATGPGNVQVLVPFNSTHVHPSPLTLGNPAALCWTVTVTGPAAASTPRLLTAIVAWPGWPTVKSSAAVIATSKSTARNTLVSTEAVLLVGDPSLGELAVADTAIEGASVSAGMIVKSIGGSWPAAATALSVVHRTAPNSAMQAQPGPEALSARGMITVVSLAGAVPMLLTVAVAAPGRPTYHGPGASTVTDRSAGTAIGVVSVSMLFAVLASNPVAVTLSDAVRSVVAATPTVTVSAG